MQPRHHHYLLGAVVAVSATAILIAGAPYLLAQSDPTQTTADTSLTAPAPNTVVPPATVTPIEPVDTTQPPQALLPFPQPTPEQLKQMQGEIMMKQFPGGIPPQGMPFGDQGTQFGDGMEPRMMLDPRELQMATREITQLKREVKRLERQLAKLQNAADELKQAAEVTAKLNEFSARIKAGGDDPDEVRDAVEEFREAGFHEQVGSLRAKVELPKRLKQLEQELKRVQRLGAQPSFQKLGIEVTKLTARLEELRTAYNAALQEVKQGNFEDAMESMHELELDGHPGEAVMVMYRLRDLQRFLKPVKDKEVQAEAQAIITPIVAAFNAGEFNQARELMDEAFQQLTSLSQVALRLERGRTGNRGDLMDKFDALEEKLREKIEFLENKELEEDKVERRPIRRPVPPKPAATAPAPANSEGTTSAQ